MEIIKRLSVKSNILKYISSYQLFFVIVSLLFLFITNVNADMGRISSSDAKVSEESQKAIIFHNLDEELLILGTDLKADRKTGIIRFIPFPSEPKVGLAEGDPFKAASELIKKRKLMFLMYSKGGISSAPPVETGYHEKIGAHDIIIIRINDVSGFRKWVNEFFPTKGLPQKEAYPDVEGIAEDYVKRGINYFVFDFVEVNAESRFIAPVIYRFKSKELYYPLKTSNTFGGSGSIDLIVAVPGTFCPSPATPYDSCSGLFGEFAINETSTSSEVTASELKDIYPEADVFFNRNKTIFVQLINFYGKYDFQNDISFDLSKVLPYAVGYAEEGQGSPWKFPMDEVIDNAIKDIKKRCSLKPEQGPCKAIYWKYYFDSESSKCREFIWGGCNGVVPFETEEECMRMCVIK